MHGHLPDYQFAVAPTPHPLATLVSMGAAPFASYADDILLGISFLSLAGLVWSIFRLGSLIFSWPVGLLAAAIVATRQPLDSLAIRAYVDIPFLALIVYAAVLEARKPKRGLPVFVLLALAGLMRPEAWPIAVLYLLYFAWDLPWSGRIRYGLLAATAPVLWLLADLAITGDPLHSLHGTSELAAQLERRRSLLDVPVALPESLGYIMREPVLIGTIPGVVYAWLFARRRALLPAALIAINGLTFVSLAIAGLPLLARYILIAAAMLALFCSAAALGWLELPPGRERRVWAIVGACTLALLAAFVPAQYDRLAGLHNTTIGRGQMQEDIRRLVDQRSAKPYLKRCRPVYAPNYRPVPMLRYWLSASPDEVISAYNRDRSPRRGVMLAPRTPQVRRLFVLDPRDRKLLNVPVPKTFKRVAKNRSWALYASPSCMAA